MLQRTGGLSLPHRRLHYRYGLFPRLLLCSGLAGCSVGPDYHRPGLQSGAGYIAADTKLAPSGLPGVASQRFSENRDVLAQWWAEFGSPELNGLIDEALARNPDIASARAALRAARATLAADQGTLFPQIAANFSASRQSNSAALASPLNSNAQDFNLYTGQLNIAYAPDVFGGIRRQIETASAQAESQKFTVEAAFLSLTSNVVVAAIQVASLRAQIEASESVVKADQTILDALKLEERLGETAGNDVAAQEAVVAQAKSSLPQFA